MGAKQILNRREKLVVSDLPPEIPDTSNFITKSDKATASALGVVKIGDNINVSSGKISVPVAAADTAGVVKVGSGLTMTDGVLSANGGSGGGCIDLFVRSTELSNNVEYDLDSEAANCKVLFVFTIDTEYPNVTGYGNCNFAFVPQSTPSSPDPEYSIVTWGLTTNPGCKINIAKTKFYMTGGTSRYQIERIVGLK